MGNCNVTCGPTGSSSIIACYRIGAETFVPVEIVRLSDNSKPPRVYRLGTRERIIPVDPDRLFIPGGCNPDANGEPNIVTDLVLGEDNNLTLSQTNGDDIIVDLSSLAEDFYADDISFDAETRELTITRTGGLDPLVVEIPSELQFPDEGTPFFLLQRGSDGSLTEGRLFLGTLQSTDVYSGDVIVPAVVGDATNTAAFGRLTGTPDPTARTLAKRGDEGTLKAEDPVEPDDLVTLRFLEEFEGTYVDSLEFDADTRVLTLTQTGDHEPLEAEIPGLAFPAGTEGQIITYDENGDVVLGHIMPINFNPDLTPDILPENTYLFPTFFKIGDSVISTVSEGSADPARLSVAMYSYIVDTEDAYLRSDTPDDDAGGEAADHSTMVVNKAYLQEKLPNFHATEVGSGAVLGDLTTVGEYVGATASTEVDNTTGEEPMVGIARFTSFSSALRRVGNGAMHVLEQLSYDGGETWIDLAPNTFDRSGADAGLNTAEVCLLVRASAFTVPPGETLSIATRVTIVVETPYGAGSSLNLGHELEVIAGTQRP